MIKMNDFSTGSEKEKLEIVYAFEEVMRSGWYILGKELELFEREWATFCKTNYAVGVANGMDAIEIILRSLRISAGDEVLTTSMSAFATTLAILKVGAKPVFADIDPSTGLLDIDGVEALVTSKTKAVLLVHLYGQMRNVGAWQELCHELGLYLIEDCAQSHLANENGVYAGGFGIAGAYSFYPTKNLGALGDAGAIITNNQDLSNLCGQLRNYGQTERYKHDELGLNSRLDEVQAAVLRVKLRYLAASTERRRCIANRYMTEIDNSKLELLLPPIESSNHSYHLFVVKSKSRDFLALWLKECGIETFSHYPVPIHLQRPIATQDFRYKSLDFTEKFAKEVLSLPIHPGLTDDQISHVIQSVNRF